MRLFLCKSPPRLRLLILLYKEPVVVSPLLHQFPMGSPLHDFSVPHGKNDIRIRHSREPVGDHEGSAPPGQRFNRLLNPFFVRSNRFYLFGTNLNRRRIVTMQLGLVQVFNRVMDGCTHGVRSKQHFFVFRRMQA